MIKPYLPQIIITIVVLLIYSILRFVVIGLIKKVANHKTGVTPRINLIIKYINVFMLSILALVLLGIWGIDGSDIGVFVSTVSAIIGVAFFAQWSILSNITAGIVIFFAFPFKIGDVIKIQDKDFPIVAEIEDIKAFYILLKTKDGEHISFPNNLILQKPVSVIDNKKILEEFYHTSKH
ncbi:MAG: mechanosensitive ion channel family protein [Flavobacterium sp.]|nr:mechanosensitive ion channel family protein [Candidatus Neoflavobacterium equi]